MRFCGDTLTHRFGPARVVRGGGVLAAAGLAGMVLLGSAPAAIVGFTCVGVGLAAGFPIALSAAGRTAGMTPAAAIGAVATAGYSGLLAGPPLIGFIAERAGLSVSLLFVASLCLVTALLAGAVRR
jgi:fucose permease